MLKVILLKNLHCDKYELWKRLDNQVLDWEFINMFEDVNIVKDFCEKNDYKIQSIDGVKYYK